MDSSKDYSTLEEVDEHFSKKISVIKECIELKAVDDDAMKLFPGIATSVVELQDIFRQVKDELKTGHKQLTEMKAFVQCLESVDSRLDHMKKNFPAVLKCQSQEVVKREKTEGTNKNSSDTPVVSRKSKMPTMIKTITFQEFDSIPQYMKGRLSYSQINHFIDSFNLAIGSKYKFLSVPRKTMKPADYKMFNLMKSQENEETKGKYFCSAENLKDFANIKLDKSTDNFLTILRHCKRIKEVRGPGSFKRYVIISE